VHAINLPSPHVNRLIAIFVAMGADKTCMAGVYDGLLANDPLAKLITETPGIFRHTFASTTSLAKYIVSRFLGQFIG
jgi:hypothetical protein